MRGVFAKTSAAAEHGDVYDPDARTVTTAPLGRPPLLATDGPKAQLAADELEGGGSRKSATEVVNEFLVPSTLS